MAIAAAAGGHAPPVAGRRTQTVVPHAAPPRAPDAARVAARAQRFIAAGEAFNSEALGLAGLPMALDDRRGGHNGARPAPYQAGELRLGGAR